MTPQQDERQVSALERIATALEARNAPLDDQTAQQLATLSAVADERDTALVRATAAENAAAALADAVQELAPDQSEAIRLAANAKLGKSQPGGGAARLG